MDIFWKIFSQHSLRFGPDQVSKPVEIEDKVK